MPYYAHSKEGLAPEHWHSLEAHLHATAALAGKFADDFQSGDWAFNAGLFHDLGKSSNEFQAYLMRENGIDDSGYDISGSGRVNHSSAGAALVEDQLKLPGRILAYIIAGHHAGLPDWHTADTGMAALSARLPEGRKNLEVISSFSNALFNKTRPVVRPPAFIKRPEHYHLWIRMLFSCLVDADFLDTEKFMSKQASDGRGEFPSIPVLLEQFSKKITEIERRAEPTSVNLIRTEIRKACELASEHKRGIFSLTVPTGGGKTLSSMAFALRHALRHGQKRIIYVIPYTSIIEQTADEFARIFGNENIIQHHSNLDPERETQRSRMAAENWDAPIIVTTNVQFFESLYAAKSSRCRKIHNIVNSVVVLDEAQLLPPELLTPCVDIMNQLVENYGVSMVLSTATQPALPGLIKPFEIMPDPGDLYRRLIRTDIRFPDSLDEPVPWGDLAQRLLTHEKVLCIVNTRRDCYQLFNLMPEGTVHLSALMCGEHRSNVISEIKAKLKAGQPVRVISTQLVEAGVDIDFPVVYRAISGLSSIAQAAGRCNREGKMNDQSGLGQVHVFIPPKQSPPGLLRKSEDTTRELYSIPDFDPQHLDIFTRYFELFYSRVNDMGTKFHDWLVKDVHGSDRDSSLLFQFRTAAANFRIIDDQKQRPVIVRYGDSDKWLKELRFLGPTRKIMRRLQRYSVSLPTRMVDVMLAEGRLEMADSKTAPDVIIQCSLNLYNDKTGLDIYKETMPVEDLIQ